jgi:hypothetical protein
MGDNKHVLSVQLQWDPKDVDCSAAAAAAAVASLVSTVAPGDDTYGCCRPKNSLLAAAAVEG